MSDLRSPPPGSELLAAHEAKRRAQLGKSALQTLVRQLESRNAELELGLDALLGALDQVTAPVPIVARASKGLPEATAVALASDWHPGERVRPNEVGGANEYSPSIFEARAERYWQSLVKLVQANRSGWDIRRLLLWLGGDLMTGWIHEEYVAENFLSPTEELYLVFETLCRGLRFLLAELDVEQILVATSNGNHGRDTDRMWSAGAFRTSYEFLLYRLLAREFRDEPRLSWQLGEGYENLVTVYGVRVAFHHGHEVKYNGGVGGIAPSMYRRIHRLSSGPTAADLYCSGHHHSLGFYPRATNNGSLIGATPYGIGKGFAPEEPMQAFFLIDAKHKAQAAMSPLFVKERRRRGNK